MSTKSEFIPNWSKICLTFLLMAIAILAVDNYRRHRRQSLATNQLQVLSGNANHLYDGAPGESSKIQEDSTLSSVTSGFPTPWIDVHFSECGFTRRVRVGRTDTKSEPVVTTCGEEAFVRGFGQKVAAFSLFRSAESKIGKYFAGIELNAKAIHDLYPELTMRVYHNLTDEAEFCKLRRGFPNLDFCSVFENPLLGNMNAILPRTWRFMAMLDDQVDLAIFRDLDSVISERESLAVRVWMQQSKKPVHVMRDHPGHSMPILAGMWGIQVKPLRRSLRRIMNQWLKDPMSTSNSSSSADQFLLGKYIWPWAKDRCIQHDSFFCTFFGRSYPWPTRRLEGAANNFVGAPFALNSSMDEECPEKCRPRDHKKEWRFC